MEDARGPGKVWGVDLFADVVVFDAFVRESKWQENCLGNRI